MDEIQFHPEAKVEYLAALTFYQTRSPQSATLFESEIDRTLNMISANPAMFPAYDRDHHFAILRRFPYSIVYRIRPGMIEILAIAHSRRADSYWKGRV